MTGTCQPCHASRPAELVDEGSSRPFARERGCEYLPEECTLDQRFHNFVCVESSESNVIDEAMTPESAVSISSSAPESQWGFEHGSANIASRVLIPPLLQHLAVKFSFTWRNIPPAANKTRINSKVIYYSFAILLDKASPSLPRP